MTESNKAIARQFFAALTAGVMPDELLAPDMTAWTTSSGVSWPKERYQGGVKLMASLFPKGVTYTIDSLTAEDDRVAAEVQSQGTLSNGEEFGNRYVFMLRIREGRIASVAEHFNPKIVEQKLVPLIQAAMSQTK